MRSSPANASVIWVPMDAICMTGATTTPVNSRYRSRSPTVHAPAMIACPPMTIISAPMTPMAREAADVVAETPVTVFATFRSSRWTPPANTRCSRFSTL